MSKGLVCPECGSILISKKDPICNNVSFECIGGHKFTEDELYLEYIMKGGPLLVNYLNRLKNILKNERIEAKNEALKKSFNAELISYSFGIASFEVKGGGRFS